MHAPPEANMKKIDGVYHLEPLAEIIETAIYTASIRDEVPISLILVGPSGSAKSKLIRSYQCDHIHMTDSITSAGLFEIAQRDIKNEKKFIFMPDINPTLSRRTSTTTATVGNLLSITGDGTVRIDDGRGEKKCEHAPLGLITACTPEIYNRHAKQWYILGLTRRIIPIFFSYCSTTLDDLQKLVRENQIHASFGIPRDFKLPPTSRPVIDGIGMFEFENKSMALAVNLGKLQFTYQGSKKWMNKDIVPISPHVTLRTLAMAHALKRKSGTVEQPEIEFVQNFVSFTDPAAPRQL